MKIILHQVPPYLMEKSNSSNNTVEPDRHCWNQRGDYIGYLVDLLDEISQHLEKRYELQIVSDSQYGKEDGDAWTGMIGEVIRGVRINFHQICEMHIIQILYCCYPTEMK